MRLSVSGLALAAVSLVHAVPNSSCATVTTEVIVPTTTYTFLSTFVTTSHPTTAENLGTYTYTETIYTTTTLETLTTTKTACTATGTVTKPHYKTVYSTPGASPPSYGKAKRALELDVRVTPCTVTSTYTTYYGPTYTYIPANQTSTFTDYTAYSQATVTVTKHGGKAYTIATHTATTKEVCGHSTVTAPKVTSTLTYNARCTPPLITSAYDNFGIEYMSGSASGASYYTTTDDPESCCELCAQADQCSDSAWDIRSGSCQLQFFVYFETGALSCYSGIAFYDAGPAEPMSPGSGLYVANGCAPVSYFNAPPDDGT